MSIQRTAVITGTSSGFGRLAAEAFAADGWKVYGTLRNVATRNAAAAEALRAAGVTPVELDVTDDRSVEAAATRILGESPVVDVLVNNAGQAFFGVTEAFTPETVARQLDTNVLGPLRVNRAFLPAMRERKAGLVIYVSSIVGRLVVPFAGPYIASKFALEAFAETTAYELAPFGVDVAIVQPGAFTTSIAENITGADDAARVASYGDVPALAEKVSAGLGAAAAERDAADVARAILALANAPAGTRPLRTTVPADEATDAINATAASIQRAVLEHFGLGVLLPKETASA
ncbi:MAG: SDR family oxidoreductase [Candidatus Eremiobacteraeota bacterium]|nr:SDR family oxidoreductase [Candidatus Eremiobacteraeota bacterium]MBV9409015.1 SDR family oxidoreductase [Candidatus Eremiobacteraeota bacterium]